MVDIISGTSAGGINGVFLAKALARNQTMQGLKNLWLEEGDLGKLLNDNKAEDYSRDLGFAVQKPERSLLNSQRMYRKLLEALEQMGNSSHPDKSAPLVNEFDLFVTTTDIEGIPLPIDLDDNVVYERRYRNVYHFRYAPHPIESPDPRLRRDDFIKENDPFLAFAARCTSSFPFAFDAMQLGDIETVLDRYHFYGDDDPTESADPNRNNRWDDFFKDYLRLGLLDINRLARGERPTGLAGSTPDEAVARLRKAFRNRSFGDGGYLDNKPFSYATSMLRRRYADCVVDRKLLYVEPTPEHPELAPRQPRPRPDFAENVVAAVLDLPRQETIREDIERIDERNQMLNRIATFARNVDEDVILLTKREEPLDHGGFRKAYLDKMINIYGVNYGAYHRLKVEEITSLLAEILARALGHDPESDATAAICKLVVAWCRKNYSELRQTGVPNSENAFLLDFDVRYSLRRLSFLNRRINQLAQGGPDALAPDARNLLVSWLKHLSQPAEKTDADNEHLAAPAKLLLPRMQNAAPPTNWIRDFRAQLVKIKRDKIANALATARLVEEIFLIKGSEPAERLRAKAADFDFSWETMQRILAEDDPKAYETLVEEEFKRRRKKLGDLMQIVEEVLKKRQGAQLEIASANDVDIGDGATAARVFVDYYYRNFVLYDLVTYPVQYGTGAGETSVVKVHRLSPEDAGSIMEETAGGLREKLAGRTVMSFGAFLDPRWRTNDIIWGRLDGAERLIAVSLPESLTPKDRQALLFEAHLGILSDEFKSGNGDAVCRLLSNARKHPHKNASDDAYVFDLIATFEKQNPGMTDAQRNLLRVPQKLDRHLESETALKYISRSTNITGNMLSELADSYRSKPAKRFSAWVAQVGTILWELIAVAVPQGLGSLFFRHWRGLLYGFAFTLIVAGILFNSSVKLVGWQILAAVAVIHLLVSGLDAWMENKRWFFKVGAALVAAPFLALVVLGVLHLLGRWAQIHFNRWGSSGLSRRRCLRSFCCLRFQQSCAGWKNCAPLRGNRLSPRSKGKYPHDRGSARKPF